MNRIVRHLWAAIRHEKTQRLAPVFDSEKPIRSTGDMLPWYTGHPFDGVVRKYRPDFLIRMRNGAMLVLEVKGQDSPQNQAKRAALHQWAHAVTEHGGFGKWTWGVSKSPSDFQDAVRAASH